MFDPLFDVVTSVLAWFYSLWPSYGMAIAFLTVTAMVAITPLTLKFTRAMLDMQRHMPELKKIQNQHRGDRQAMSEATAAFYKERGINPVGCLLPMLAQGPIFIVMYRVVHGLTRRTTEIGTQLGFTSRRCTDPVSGATADCVETPIARGELAFDPDFLSRDTDLYARLSDNVEMVSWGVDLSRSASSAVASGVVVALPYLLLMGIVLVTGLFQQRQIQGRQGAAAANPQQQMVAKLIPYVLPVICYGMPAAVVVYFIVSNLVRIAQQTYITRSFYKGEDSLGAQIAKQRAAAASEESARAASGAGKGVPTPKRDAKAKPSRASAPSRKRTSGTVGTSSRKAAAQKGAPARTGPSGRSGRTGKAPTRRTGGRPEGGRVTPPGSGARRPSQNRSRNKKKRR